MKRRAQANADSGTTGHYFALRDMKYLTDVKKITNGIRVSLPNGDFVTSKYTKLIKTTQSLPAAPIQHTAAVASVHHSVSLVVKLDSKAEVARFWHAAFGSPAISTFNTALKKVLIAIRGVTPKIMRNMLLTLLPPHWDISVKQGKVSDPPDALWRVTA